MINVLKFSLVFALFTLIFTACTQEEFGTTDAEEFATLSTTELQERTATGFGGCFEMVFPIEIKFVDGTTVSIDSAKGFKDAIKTWKQANPDLRTKPTLVFPISVLNSDGVIVVVENSSELRDLRKECPRKFGPHHGKGNHCFRLNFPFTIKTASGELVVINSAEDVKNLRGQKGKPRLKRPELVFPVSVTLKNGDIQEVGSKEELKALKDDCN
ncbi:MAG TPA: hypothetical protein PKD85_06970 [Saprospiraceae bacterium]|nr:hypothetical protein [Saprospiraceae bacterium]